MCHVVSRARAVVFGLALGLAFTLLAGNANAAADYYWNATPSGDWAVVGNWYVGSQTSGIMPTDPPPATLDVYINNGGTAVVDPASGVAASLNLLVGYTGTGTLEVTGGGTAMAADIIYIGANNAATAGAIGTVTVSGPGSKLSAGTFLYVGGGFFGPPPTNTVGTGTLILENGGVQRAQAAFSLHALPVPRVSSRSMAAIPNWHTPVAAGVLASARQAQERSFCRTAERRPPAVTSMSAIPGRES